MMAQNNWRSALLLACLPALGLGSCAPRRRVATPKILPQADRGLASELSDQIAEQYREVSNFKATVVMSATMGKPGEGKFKRYPIIRGFILFRKPAEMRIIGQDPLMQIRLFDLASNGEQFRLWIPSKREFVVGDGEVKTSSANKLENIPPRNLAEVILPRPVHPATETATAEEAADGGGYILHLARKVPAGKSAPSRTIWIDGVTLHVAREVIFSQSGATLTDARYSEWMQSGGVIFPRRIEIDRPQDGYHLLIRIPEIEINKGLSSDLFVLKQPPGTQLVKLGPGAPRERHNPSR